MPCARLCWPYYQLLSARKYMLSYSIQTNKRTRWTNSPKPILSSTLSGGESVKSAMASPGLKSGVHNGRSRVAAGVGRVSHYELSTETRKNCKAWIPNKIRSEWLRCYWPTIRQQRDQQFPANNQDVIPTLSLSRNLVFLVNVIIIIIIIIIFV